MRKCDKFYWLDRETGDVLIVDDWSEGRTRELDSHYDPNRFDTSYPLSYNRGQQVRPGR